MPSNSKVTKSNSKPDNKSKESKKQNNNVENKNEGAAATYLDQNEVDRLYADLRRI